ncbi:hypothetical protein [Rhizobium sp. TRM95796]|uniref:hypothetical protein n=1 Tax=Rhizobium sp. TRM95796 TaxID=2979862 RepID=UPI0021E92FE3|nr:hypothetical protein [Rhizobium sp. TRM95796]MCV3768903.1 hypothetical protein [Rhizobium sp. TRM95796]
MTHVESLSDFQDDRTKINRAFMMPLAEALDEFVEYLERLPPRVRSMSLVKSGMELWIDRPGWMDIVDSASKRRDEKIVSLPCDATAADLAAAVRDSGWSIVLMALLAIDDTVIRPQETDALIRVAADGLSAAIKVQTNRRRGREPSTGDNVRPH